MAKGKGGGGKAVKSAPGGGGGEPRVKPRLKLGQIVTTVDAVLWPRAMATSRTGAPGEEAEYTTYKVGRTTCNVRGIQAMAGPVGAFKRTADRVAIEVQADGRGQEATE